MKSIDFLKAHNVAVDQSLELFGDVETYNDTLVEFKNGIDGKLERIDKFFKEGKLETIENDSLFNNNIFLKGQKDGGNII